MRKLVVLSVFILLISILRVSAVSYIRVNVSDKADVIRLAENGFHLLDARVRMRTIGEKSFYSVRWFEENGFVTVEGDRVVAGKIRRLGYNILKTGESHPAVFPSGGRNLPFQFGWPRNMSGWPGVYGQATTIDDLNGDGIKEIFLNNIEGYIYMWKPTGASVLGYPHSPYLIPLVDPQTGDTTWVSWATTGSRETAAAGDVNGDGQKEFVFGKDIGYLFAYQYGFNPYYPPGFPRNLGLAIFSNDPALADLDNDGKDEIVLVTYMWPTGSYTYGPAEVHIFNEDGSELPGWPQQIPVNSESSPVIGDIDGDFKPEIVVGSGHDPNLGTPGRIYAWNLDGTLCSGFPIEVGYSVENTPSLADIDLNGFADVLIRVKMQSTEINGIYAFNGQGQLLPGFPAIIPRGGSVGAPAVADMDGDGFPEIAIGTVLAVDSGMVYVFNFDGTLKPGFPQLVYRTWVEESVALADVSGDGLPDVVATTNGTSNSPGAVWAFDYQGNTVSGFPIVTPAIIGSSLESAPSVIDIDGDGDTELFTANWNGDVFAWDTPGIPDPGNSWPMYKYNPARTGNNLSPYSGIRPANAAITGQFELLPNYPNPFNPETQIGFRISDFPKGAGGFVELRVYDLAGRKIATLINKELPAGYHTVRWDGKNSAGQEVSSGVYFYQLKTARGTKVRKMILLR